MAFGSTFNKDDPRYQQQMLRAQGKGFTATPGGVRGLQRRITGDFAGEQLAKDLQFADIFDRFNFAKANRQLDHKKLAFQKKMFGKNMRSEERGLTITTAAGLGTGVLNYMQGKRRAKLQEEERQQEIKAQDAMEKLRSEAAARSAGTVATPFIRHR